MAEVEFTLVYDGPALADGRMEVRELAPALLALAEMFREANGTINPDVPPVTLHIKATEPGSFDIVLVLKIAEAAVTILTSRPITAIMNLKSLVVGKEGIFSLVQALRGRSITGIEQLSHQADNMLTIRMADGDVIEYPKQTYDTYLKHTIKRRTREVLAPLEADGVEVAQFRDSETEHVVELRPADIPRATPLDPDGEPITSLDSSGIALEITTAHFREGLKWRLTDGGSNNSYLVTMEDEGFLAKVERGEIFAKGDILVCDLHLDQFRTDSDGLRSEYTVTRVREHIHREPTVPTAPFPQMGPNPTPQLGLPPGENDS